MIIYHGTTRRRAQRICQEGFLPRKPSRRVWFAESRAYAEGRARTQARRAHDRAAVLTCEVDVPGLRQRLGPKRVMHRNRVIAIDGPVPVSVLRSHPGMDLPTTPRELARWVNALLGLKPHKGVGAGHPGIDRLSRWVNNRLNSRPDSLLKQVELVQMARQWLGEYFAEYRIDLDRLRAFRRPATVELEVDADRVAPDPRVEQAVEWLESDKPRRRVRGLGVLAKAEDPDLFDWCVMFLDDNAAEVQVAALRTMRLCRDGEPEVILPLVQSDDRRVRGAAIAALAHHAGAEAPGWFERGLKDPSACIRLETAAVLNELEPSENREIFELALHDPNPQVSHLAEKYTAHQGFRKEG